MVGAFYYFLLQKNQTEETPQESQTITSPSEAQSPVETEEEESEFLVPDTIENLIHNHRLASGFGAIKSYILVGTFGINVGKTEINLKARAPNFYKFKTEYLEHGLMVEFGFNGQQLWIGAVPPDKTKDEIDTFKDVALVESSLTHLAWSMDTSDAIDSGLDSILELRPEENWKGRDYYVVRSRRVLTVEMDHYIDQETYLEAFRKVTLIDNSGKATRVRIEYAAPDGNAEHSLPSGYRIYTDDELSDVVKFDKIRVNQVIFEAVFSPPSDY